ncbi:MAG: 3-deoxy-8-phosphooctulonate synthase [Kiritimatiellae bacterium]|nr:3-deoxy-8-phosphooctulonate synthase [Kiritimatiellia bacterium]
MTKTISMGSVKAGGRAPLFLIAGPCVIEDREGFLDLAGRLVRWTRRRGIPFVFKASYDKANRTSSEAYRGPGLEQGLEMLAEIKAKFHVPVLTDVHSPEQARRAAEVCDVLQIPAFLCRQTDLVTACGETGRVVNIKKAQFMAPWDVPHVVKKIERTGNRRILLTERGASFGYNNLVADMRSLLVLRETGYPVVFDATHSVQRPGGAGAASSGDGRWAPALARAAVATGCDGVFIETHVDPSRARSDRENAIPFARLDALWLQLSAIDRVVDTPKAART